MRVWTQKLYTYIQISVDIVLNYRSVEIMKDLERFLKTFPARLEVVQINQYHSLYISYISVLKDKKYTAF